MSENDLNWQQNLRVAMAQINPVRGDLTANIKKHCEVIEAAKKEKADVVVFPELSLTGYDIGDMSPDLALEYESPRLKKIVDATDGITAVFGMVELGFAAQLHNTVIAARDGELIFAHRKLNLPNYGELEEGKHFATGRYIECFPLQKPWFGGTMICSDAWNPALVHLIAVKGASILLVPICSALRTVNHSVYSNPEGWDLLSKFYSYTYGFPVVVVNRVGSEGNFKFWGKSFAYGPLGTVRHRCGEGEELAVVEFDHYDVVRARKNLPTVRDSNLDLISREVSRSRNTIGYPSVLNKLS